MLWIYHIPTLWLGVLVIAVFLVLSLAGLLLSRPWTRKHCVDHNELVNYFIAPIGLFYAVLVGLIALATWESYTEVEGYVANEAVAIADLYHDMEGYPPDLRADLRGMLRDYVRFVISEEWPDQRRGIQPEAHTRLLTRLVHRMATFEPATPGRQVIHAECLRETNELLTYRRLRIHAVAGGLPGLMWLVMLLGAAVTIGMTYFFWTENVLVHSLLTASLSVTIALIILLILALDRPLVGQQSVDPEAFEEVLTRVMVEPAGG
jgi:uncharacterized protein DUF4239